MLTISVTLIFINIINSVTSVYPSHSKRGNTVLFNTHAKILRLLPCYLSLYMLKIER